MLHWHEAHHKNCEIPVIGKFPYITLGKSKILGEIYPKAEFQGKSREVLESHIATNFFDASFLNTA